MSFAPMNCTSCNVFSAVGSGGVIVGGSGVPSMLPHRGSGGVIVGGSGVPDLGGNAFSGLVARYALDDLGYLDDSPNALHGTAGLIEPTISNGVLCLDSLYFQEDEFGSGAYITIPQDNITGDWSISMWVNLGTIYAPRCLFSRGHNDNSGNDLVWSLETSFLNHLVLSVQTDEGQFDAFSDITMEQNRWYHVAASVQNQTMRTFINGVEQTSYEYSGTPLTIGNGGFIGRRNLGGYPTASMQDIRLYRGAKSQSWFLAEYNNICLPGWVLVGEEEALADVVIPAPVDGLDVYFEIHPDNVAQSSDGTGDVAIDDPIGFVSNVGSLGNYTQVTESSRPLLKYDATKEMYYADFDGTNDWLNITTDNYDQLEYFIAFSASNGGALAFRPNGVPVSTLCGLIKSSTYVADYDGGDDARISLTAGEFCVLRGRHDTATELWQYDVVGSPSTNSRPSVFTKTQLDIGRMFVSSSYDYGDIHLYAFAATVNSLMSTDQVNGLKADWADKYGITFVW